MAVIHFAPLQGYTDSVYREAHTRVFGGVDTYYTHTRRVSVDRAFIPREWVPGSGY